jgi:ATP-dependent DNA helicase RecG
MDREPQLAAPAAWPPDGPVTLLPGVGPTTAARLLAAGIRSLGDLLQFLPRRYRELQLLAAPEPAALGRLVRIDGTVRLARLSWLPGRRAMVTVEFAAADGTPFAASFFNQPWLRKSYVQGQRRTVEGVLDQRGRRFVLKQPRILADDGGAPVAV